MLPCGVPLTFRLVLSVLGYELLAGLARLLVLAFDVLALLLVLAIDGAARARPVLARLTAPSKLKRPPARWEG